MMSCLKLIASELEGLASPRRQSLPNSGLRDSCIPGVGTEGGQVWRGRYLGWTQATLGMVPGFFQKSAEDDSPPGWGGEAMSLDPSNRIPEPVRSPPPPPARWSPQQRVLPSSCVLEGL